ncbi:AAA family ATPase [Ruminiclostridium cellobioparum]|uniref:AAA family ATPase n=1 Tax=Ruminiclostridium cellobioparum TaxID=29355 RepID=UPI0028A88D28|nr:AAA family ATPase [Ruminiclostridium cellobioparum]
MSVIAVWGKNGTGRSTVATNLAVYLARKGKLVGLVGTNKSYGSIQYYLGTAISEEKSLKNAIEIVNEDDIVKSFVQHPKVKDLFLMSLSNSDNCLKLRGVKEDAGKRLILNTKDKFDYYIIDCTENFTDTLTAIGCQYADIILEIMKPTIQSAAFRISHEELLESIKLKDKIVSIANLNKDLMRISDIEHKAKVKFAQILPYSKNVENAENTGEPITLLGPQNRADKEFIRKITQIAEIIENKGRIGLPNIERKKGISFIKIRK